MLNTTACKNDIVNRALSLLREQGIMDSSIEPSTDTERLVNLWYSTALEDCLLDIVPTFAIKRAKLLKEKEVYADTLEDYKEQKNINNNNNDKKKPTITDEVKDTTDNITDNTTEDDESSNSTDNINKDEENNNIGNNLINDCDKINIKDNLNLLYAYRIPNDCLRILNERENSYFIEGNYIYSAIDDETFNLRYLAYVNELYEREIKFNLCLSYYLAYYICADLCNNDSKLQTFLQLKDVAAAQTRTFYLKQKGVYFNKEYRWKR